MKTDRSIAPSDKLAAEHQPLALRSAARRNTLALSSALLFGAALLIRLYRLGSQSLWLDEGGTWAEVTSKSWPALLAELWGRNAAYPLYHVLLKGWVGLAGDSEWTLRLPSALAGAAAVVAIYLAAADHRPTTNDLKNREPRTQNREPRTEGRGLGRDQGSSITHRILRFMFYVLRFTSYPSIAGLLFAVSPFALWYAQDAKVYSLLMLVVALELWALLRALRRGGRAWLLVLAAAIVSVFVHRLALLAAAGAALAYLIIWPTDHRPPTTDHRRPTTDDRPTTNDRRPTTSDYENWNSQIPTPNFQLPTPNFQLRTTRIVFGLLTAIIAGVGVLGIAAGFSNESRGTGGHIPAGPLEGL
jgi:hypothetical protein